MKSSGQLAQLSMPLLLLAIVPAAPVLAYLTEVTPPWIFLAGAAGVAVLADWVGRSTEQVAEHVGPAVGGLLAIGFGSLAEIILAMFLLANGKAAVVRAQLPAPPSARACLDLASLSWSGGSAANGRASSGSGPGCCRAC